MKTLPPVFVALASLGVLCLTLVPATAQTWTLETNAPTDASWTSVASSSDGTKLVAVSDGNGFYTSTDSGANWTDQTNTPLEGWKAVASSADGAKLIAAPSVSMLVFTFSDSGSNWNLRLAFPEFITCVSVASSADGTKLVAAGTGAICTSSDSGTNWIHTSAPDVSWDSIASSADGSKLVAAAAGGGIYTSSDSGINWTEQTNAPTDADWTSIASSSDGSKLVATANFSDNGIYTSTDSGTNWTIHTNDLPIYVSWDSVASSADGTKLAAAVYNGGVYTSTDTGMTWKLSSPTEYWYSIASSADGTKLVGATYDGGSIYRAVLSPSITSSPANVTNSCGSSVVFTIIADGAPDLVYQWYKGTNPISDDTVISGSSTASLTFTGITLDDQGSYMAIVTNAYGLAYCDYAILEVTNASPVELTLLGPLETNIIACESFEDPGATATSGCTPSVTVTTLGEVNLYALGTYILTYSATDAGITVTTNRTVIVSQVNPSEVPTYDAVSDFTTNNPNGVWSYGWNDNAGGPFQIMTNITAFGPVIGYWNGLALPDSLIITRNLSAPPYQGGTVWFDPDTLEMDPQGDADLVRFTAPADGLYWIHGFFRVQDTTLTGRGWGASFAIDVDTNTSSPVFSDNSAGGDVNEDYYFSVTNYLTEGTPVDFIVACPTSPTQEGNYQALSSGLEAIVTPLSAIQVPPFITSSPAGVTNGGGSPVIFSAMAAGPSPLAYQWYDGTNSLSDSFVVAGSSSSSLTLSGVTIASEGGYCVVVTNVYGSSTSAVANLVVTNPGTCFTAPSGIVGWWPGNGDANDVVGGRNGSLANGATFAPGLNGQAFSLDGVSGYVYLGAWTVGSTWTVEAWVNPSSVPLDRRIIAGGVLNCSDWGINLNGGQFCVISKPPGGCTQSTPAPTPISTGTWYHIAGTCDRATARIYVNGVLQNSAPVEPNYVGDGSGVAIGAQLCCGENFGGLVDEVSIFNRALTPDEIASIYMAGSYGKCEDFAPTILAAPQSQTVLCSSNPVFNVSAEGQQPLYYFWQRNGTNLTDGGNIIGSLTSSLTIANANCSDSDIYSVLVTNALGSDGTSATLTVIDTSTPIIALPNGGTTNRASGFAYSAPSATASDTCAGVVTVTSVGAISTTNTNGTYLMTYVASNANGDSTTNTLNVVLSTIAILNQPQNQSVDLLSNAVFSVTAQSTNTLQYQWYSLINGKTAKLAGKTASSFTLTSVKPAEEGSYYVMVEDTVKKTHPAVTTHPDVVTSTMARMALNRSTLTVHAKGGTTKPLGTITYGLATNGATLYVGHQYKISATPAPGYVFTNWTDALGTILGTSERLTFLMSNNLTLNANFNPNPVLPAVGQYNGLFYNYTNGVTEETAGFLGNLLVKSNNKFSGKLMLNGKTFILAGTFDASGNASNVITRTAESLPNLAVQMQLQWTNSPPDIQGTVSNMDASDPWVSSLQADLADTSSNMLAGEYDMVIPPPDGVSPLTAPAGYGYLTITNNPKNHQIVLSGQLADGTTIAQSVPLSLVKDEVPFFVSLYGNKGLIMGWLLFMDSSNPPDGNVTWIQPGGLTKPTTYPSGFTNNMYAFGSPLSYSFGFPALYLVDGALDIYDADISGLPLQFNVSVNNNNQIVKASGGSTNAMSGSINPRTGLMTIKFLPTGAKPTQMKTAFGVILQSGATFYGPLSLNKTGGEPHGNFVNNTQIYGAGAIIGTNQDGGVTLEQDY